MTRRRGGMNNFRVKICDFFASFENISKAMSVFRAVVSKISWWIARNRTARYDSTAPVIYDRSLSLWLCPFIYEPGQDSTMTPPPGAKRQAQVTSSVF